MPQNQSKIIKVVSNTPVGSLRLGKSSETIGLSVAILKIQAPFKRESQTESISLDLRPHDNDFHRAPDESITELKAMVVTWSSRLRALLRPTRSDVLIKPDEQYRNEIGSAA